jgi:Na+/melibiose symporter-like transporter
MRNLKEYPLVRRYLWGQSVSILGDTALWLALGIWVRELTGSSAEAGLTFFFLAAPAVIGPVWGTIADRYPRRRILFIGNIASGLMTLALLGVHDRHQVWLIWVVMVGYGSSLSLLSAAQSGFLHTLLPEEHLGDAQGWLSTVREGLRLVAPLIGAGVFALVGGHAVALIDLSTFVIALATLVSIRVEEPKPEPRPARWRDEVAAGWVHIRTVRPLAQIVLALTVCCTVIGLTETAVFAIITTGLHLSAAWVGGWQMLMGVGALVGGPTVGMAMRRLGEGRVAALGMVGWALASGLEAVPNLGAVAAGAAVGGFCLPWIIAPAMTFMQRSTPSSLQGRVSSTVDVLTSTPQSLSIAAGAALLTILGYQVLMIAVAVVTLGAGLWLVSRPEQRRRTPAAAVEEPSELVSLAADGVVFERA